MLLSAESNRFCFRALWLLLLVYNPRGVALTIVLKFRPQDLPRKYLTVILLQEEVKAIKAAATSANPDASLPIDDQSLL